MKKKLSKTEFYKITQEDGIVFTAPEIGVVEFSFYGSERYFIKLDMHFATFLTFSSAYDYYSRNYKRMHIKED